MDMMEEVRTRLAGTNKVVIVDEAQHLKLPAIEELRSLSDPDIVTGTPGNGVCLIGNSEVYDRIRGKAQAEFAPVSYTHLEFGVSRPRPAPNPSAQEL